MFTCVYFSSHCALIPSHRGQLWKATADLQVQLPRNEETALCGRRRWTSIRRAPSLPKRSRDRRLLASGSVKRRLWTKLTSNSLCAFIFLGNLWTFQRGAGPHWGSSACAKGRKNRTPQIMQSKPPLHLCWLCGLHVSRLGIPWPHAETVHHDRGGASSHFWWPGCLHPFTWRYVFCRWLL